MKALSIRQPWAWAILHAGKDIENRVWKLNNPNRRFRGEFLIHASRGMTHAEYDEFIDAVHLISTRAPFPPYLDVPEFRDLPVGGIVGIAKMVDIVTDHPSPWFFGPVGLVLKDVRPTKFIPLRGYLGFFNVPEEIVREAA